MAELENHLLHSDGHRVVGNCRALGFRGLSRRTHGRETIRYESNGLPRPYRDGLQLMATDEAQTSFPPRGNSPMPRPQATAC
jgi:hypothetical protein